MKTKIMYAVIVILITIGGLSYINRENIRQWWLIEGCSILLIHGGFLPSFIEVPLTHSCDIVAPYDED